MKQNQHEHNLAQVRKEIFLTAYSCGSAQKVFFQKKFYVNFQNPAPFWEENPNSGIYPEWKQPPVRWDMVCPWESVWQWH